MKITWQQVRAVHKIHRLPRPHLGVQRLQEQVSVQQTRAPRGPRHCFKASRDFSRESKQRMKASLF